MHVPVEVCIERNSKRKGFEKVPDGIIEKSLEKLEKPNKDYGLLVGNEQDQEIIKHVFDILSKKTPEIVEKSIEKPSFKQELDLYLRNLTSIIFKQEIDNSSEHKHLLLKLVEKKIDYKKSGKEISLYKKLIESLFPLLKNEKIPLEEKEAKSIKIFKDFLSKSSGNLLNQFQLSEIYLEKIFELFDLTEDIEYKVGELYLSLIVDGF